MKRSIFFLFSLIVLSYSSWLYAQDNPKDSTNNTPKFCQPILDENQHILIPKKGFVLLYFLDPRNQYSIDMLGIVQQLKLKNSPITCFQVNTALSLGLKKTYQITHLPSLVVLQDKRLIYGVAGFTDDVTALTDILNSGIENHLLISSEK